MPEYFNLTEDEVRNFIQRESASWSVLQDTYPKIDLPENTRRIEKGITAVYQPWRRLSSTAEITADAIAARECFLCPKTRMSGQTELNGGSLHVLMNPFPVLKGHLTIPWHKHVPQKLDNTSIKAFCELCFALRGFTVFYNGSECGASAPDHLHFQAIPDWTPQIAEEIMVSHIRFEARDVEDACTSLNSAIKMMPVGEQMINLAGYGNDSGIVTFMVIPRKARRPHFYSSDETDLESYMISPAAIEMLGIFITPLEKDFRRLNINVIKQIYFDTGLESI